MFLNINNKLNITLCGMMGSGKSSIGKILAKKLKYNYIDTDKLIEEKTKKTIKKIFEEDGEQYFRNLEEKITTEILNNKKSVISLGGGAIINKNIRSTVKKNSYNVYLKVNIEILNKRLQNSTNRPLVNNNDLKKTLHELIIKREKFYLQADLVVKNEKGISDTIKNILKKIDYE